MTTDWLLRVSDGKHFISSSSKNIWGISSKVTAGKGFLSRVKEGDRLWFVTAASNGHIIAVATFTETKQRILGPLFNLTATNEELGWTQEHGEWDIEVHYKDLYNLTSCKLYSEIKGNSGIRLYNENCKVKLAEEYPYIVRYSLVIRTMDA
jgi:hypothetical protein